MPTDRERSRRSTARWRSHSTWNLRYSTEPSRSSGYTCCARHARRGRRISRSTTARHWRMRRRWPTIAIPQRPGPAGLRAEIAVAAASGEQQALAPLVLNHPELARRTM